MNNNFEEINPVRFEDVRTNRVPGASATPARLAARQWQSITAAERTYAQRQRDPHMRALSQEALILVTIAREAEAGRVYTLETFASAFRHEKALGGGQIKARLHQLCKRQDIQFFASFARYGLPKPRSPYGYLCVEDMTLNTQGLRMPVFATHRLHVSGSLVPVKASQPWHTREQA